jgi:hypothetical protein
VGTLVAKLLVHELVRDHDLVSQSVSWRTTPVVD